MNVGTIEAKLSVDATDWEKLPAAARQAGARAQQEFTQAAKGITQAMQGASSGLVDAFGRPAVAATKAAETIAAAGKKGAEGLGLFGKGAAEFAELAQRAGVSTGILGEAIGALTSPLGLAAAGLVAAGLAIREITTAMVANFRQTRELQALTGASVDAASNLADTYKILGFDIGTASQSFFRLGTQIDANSDQLKLLGVATTDATGKLRPVVDVMEEARDRVSRLGDSTSQTGVLMGLLGRGALSQLPIWQQTSEQWAVAKARAEELSGSIVRAQQVTGPFVTATGELAVASERLVLALGVGLLPPLTALLNTMTDLAHLAVMPLEFVMNITGSLGDIITGKTPITGGLRDKIRSLLGLSRTIDRSETEQDTRFWGPAPMTGPGFPTIAQAGGALANVVSQQQLTNGLQDLGVALGHVSAQFQIGAVGAGVYRFALQQVEAILEPLAQRGLPEAQKQLDGIRVALAGVDFTQTQQGLAAALQASQALEVGLLSGVKESVAARISTEEEGAVAEAAIRVATLGQQRVLLAQALADTRMNDAQRFQLTQQLAGLDSQFAAAKSVERVVLWQQETVRLKAEYDARAGLAQAQLSQELATIKGNLDSEVALYRGAFDDIVLEARAVGGAEVTAAQATAAAITAALDQQTIEAVKMYSAGLLAATAYYAKMYELSSKRVAAEIDLNDKELQARLKVMAAIVAAGEAERVGFEAGEQKLADARAAIIQSTDAFQIAQTTRTIAERNTLLANGAVAASQQESFMTGTYALESKNRIALFQTEADKRNELVITEQDAWLRAAQLRNTFYDRSAALALASFAEQQRAAGDYLGFLGTQFQLALGQVGTVYDSMTRAAQDTARNMTQGFSDFFFTVLTGKFSSLLDVVKSFGLSMLRVFTDILASQAVRGLLSLFDSILGGGGGGSGLVGALVAGAGALLKGLSGGSSASGTDALATGAGAAAKGVDLFAGSLSKAIPVIASIAGLAFGLYGLVSGIKSGSPFSAALSGVGAGLSAYSLASTLAPQLFTPLSTLIAQGFAAVAPATAAAVASALSTIAPEFATAITAALPPLIDATMVAVTSAAPSALSGGIAAGASGALAGLVNPASIFGAMLSLGGIAGQQADAEAYKQMLRETTGKLRSAASAVSAVIDVFGDLGTGVAAANLPDTMSKLQYALRSLPDLFHAVGIGAEGIRVMIPAWRAAVGATLLRTLDAAKQQGVDASMITASPVTLAENAGYGDASGTNLSHLADLIKLGTGYDPATGRSSDVLGGQLGETQTLLTHLLQLTGEQGQMLAAILAQQINAGGPEFSAATTGDAQGLWAKLMTPEHLAQIKASGDVGDLANFKIDPALINQLLNSELLTVAVRNAVVDVGAMFGITAQQANLAPGGPGQNWQMQTGDTTGFDFTGAILPDVQAIAAVKATLDAAGFTPGNYADALEKFLVSVDANIVNNPAWKTFTDRLHSAASIDEIDDLVHPGASGARFTHAAEGVMTSLSDQIAAAMEQRKVITDPEALKVADEAIAALQEHYGEWVNGLRHLHDVAASVLALAPPDLSGKMREALAPIYTSMLTAMKVGTTEQATAAAQFFAQQLSGWSAFTQSVTQAVDVNALLPTGLGDRFRAQMQPEYDAILTTLKAGNVALAAIQIDVFNKQIAAWAKIGDLVARIPQEVDASTRSVEGLIASWHQQDAQLDRAVDRAKIAFDSALASGDIESIAVASAAYHDATIARLQTELAWTQQLRDVVNQIEAGIKDLLDTVAAPLVQMMTAAAGWEVQLHGTYTIIGGIVDVLARVATSGATASIRLWAVAQGLQAIMTILPMAIAAGGSMRTAAQWLASGPQTVAQLRGSPGGPSAITGAVIGGAAPFLAAQQGAIDAATGSQRLALLKEQAAQWQRLADAAIAGINQWADQAVAGAQAAAQEWLTARARERDAAVASIDAQIKAIDTQAQLQQQANAAQIDSLNVQITAARTALATAREWESAITSMRQAIAGLKEGPLAPINQAAQLQMAQARLAAATAAFRAGPSTQGLSDIQALAQQVLGLAAPIMSKPSPAYQALFEDIVTQLQAAQAIAVAQAPDDSHVLQAQLDALVQQVDALQAVNQTIADTAAVQVETLNAQKQALIDAYTATAAEVQIALDTQTEAIRQAALDEVTAIRDDLTTALTANAVEQAALVGDQLGVLGDQLETLHHLAGNFDAWAQWDADRTTEANATLLAIKAAILAVTGQAKTAALTGASQTAAAFLPADAQGVVAAPGGAGGAPAVPPGTSPWTEIADAGARMTAEMVANPFQPAVLWTDPVANQLERNILLAQDLFTRMQQTAHYWDSQHRMHTRFSPEALAAQAAVVQASRDALVAYFAGLPHAAAGMPLVARDMAIYAHAGEAVLKPDEARAYRTGLWSGGSMAGGVGRAASGAVTVTFGDIHITVTGGDDPERISEAVWRKLKRRVEDEARSGVLGDILAKR